MEIKFEVKTNKPYPMIKTACFNMKKGFQIKVDRSSLEFYKPDKRGIAYMFWKCCFLWAIDDFYLFDGEWALLNDGDAVELLNANTQSVEFEFEDEASSDYEVEIISWECR